MDSEHRLRLHHSFGGVLGFAGVTERALREVGVWPTPDTALERMVAALEELAKNGDTRDDRTRAQKMLAG